MSQMLENKSNILNIVRKLTKNHCTLITKFENSIDKANKTRYSHLDSACFDSSGLQKTSAKRLACTKWAQKPVKSRVITPFTGDITPVTHLEGYF